MEAAYDLIYSASSRRATRWERIRLAIVTTARVAGAIVAAEPSGSVWRNGQPAAQFAALHRAQQNRLLDRGITLRV
jgi:hypothetical protein